MSSPLKMRSVIIVASLFLTPISANYISLPRQLPLPIAANASDLTSCAAASWPPTSVGSPLVPQSPDAELQAMLAEIDPARIQSIIEKLVSFGTRHTLSNQTDPNRGIGAARDWIASYMRDLAAPSNGSMQVTVPSYIQGVASRILFPTKISNVVARLEGATDPGRVYVITGHYDSRITDVNDFTSDAPGADDDASGVAGKWFEFTSFFGDVLLILLQCLCVTIASMQSRVPCKYQTRSPRR